MPRKRSSTAKPRRSRKMRGRGILSTLKTVHGIVKDNKLLSKGLGLAGIPALAAVADMAGYGRRRRRTTKGVAVPRSRSRKRRVAVARINSVPLAGRRVMRGKGIFSDLGGGIGSVFGGLGGGLGSVARGLFGGGRRRGTTMRGRAGIKI